MFDKTPNLLYHIHFHFTGSNIRIEKSTPLISDYRLSFDKFQSNDRSSTRSQIFGLEVKDLGAE